MNRLGLYVHWPFCQAKCPYCDFNSHVVAQVDHAAWRRAYAAELDRHADLIPDAIVGSIFFGGGTPSLMESETVAAVIDGARARWPLANDVEITLEANPTSVEADRFRAYRAAGVDRISLGVQALSDGDLARLGRLHSAAEARAAYDIARATFDRVSFDLIYARQDQSLAAWERELDQALGWGADHMSLYQLTVEPGTAFGRRAAAGALHGLPGEDLAADLYELTQEMTEEAGLPAYEVSNHARPGAESRHNLLYWSGGDYVGIGPGAHGRLTLGGRRIATEAVEAPLLWLSKVLAGSAPDSRTRLSPREAMEERLLMGLRIENGVPVGEFDLPGPAVAELEELGLLRMRGGVLCLTRQSRPLLNAVLRRLLS